ncbi:transposase family protein [Pseudomonas aeruginosa]|nr:transposase family protein [Pseudomonas aeruginosa]
MVARQEGVSAGLLFQWRKLERQGALTAVSAGEAVVPASELAAARAEIAKLQRVLGKKTLENEILKEAVEYAAEKKWIARSPLLPGRPVKTVCRTMGLARSHVRDLLGRGEDWTDGRSHRTPSDDAGLLAELRQEIADLPAMATDVPVPW